MSKIQSVPRTHRITVQVSDDRKVRVRPAWKRKIGRGDSVVWSFRGPIDPGKTPVVTFAPSPAAPGTPLEAFDEIAVSEHRVRGHKARGGVYECRYGFRNEAGAVEILECLSRKGKPGMAVIPPPPDGAQR